MKVEYVIVIVVLVLVALGLGFLFSTTQPIKNMLNKENQGPYKEIVSPAGFVNTEAITIGELIGKKVVLVDFLTYSCINCQRTFPYLNAWYEEYKDQGLEIVGIHTPEFAFEKDIDNVREAMRDFGITHPIVLDNDYATWRAYDNSYWPRKYLIDIHGNIVYDHIGEGAYKETESKIRELLEERAEFLGINQNLEEELATSNIAPEKNFSKSPETYFGSLRNNNLNNGLELGGQWVITEEYIESVDEQSTVSYRFNAKEVYLVAEASEPVNIEVWEDGILKNTISIEESKLYVLIDNQEAGSHLLEIRVKGQGARFFAFTFG